MKIKPVQDLTPVLDHLAAKNEIYKEALNKIAKFDCVCKMPTTEDTDFDGPCESCIANNYLFDIENLENNNG